MPSRRLLPLLTATFAAVVATPLSAKQPPPPDHWVGTWATAPLGEPNRNHLFAQDTTLREIVRISLAGPLARVILSNEFGTEPLRIGAAHLAGSSGGTAIDLSSAHALTFGGRSAITIPPGALVLSDPIALSLKPLSDLAVSLFVPAQQATTLSLHPDAKQTSYMASGNLVGQATLANAQTIHTWPILKGIDVRVGGQDAAVLCLGDSITDGALSTENANARWPNILADRLRKRHLAVLNEGIGGNRVLLNGAGPDVLARFDRDVLAQSGVRDLILLEGINDIGAGYGPKSTETNPPTAEDLITAYRQIIERAHSHGIRVFGATLTPFVGAGYASPAGEQVRQAVNSWIRTGRAFDGIVDFDATVRDKNNPAVYSSAADSGDHLHPSDAGYKSMGDSIDLNLFRKNKKDVPPQAEILPPSTAPSQSH